MRLAAAYKLRLLCQAYGRLSGADRDVTFRSGEFQKQVLLRATLLESEVPYAFFALRVVLNAADPMPPKKTAEAFPAKLQHAWQFKRPTGPDMLHARMLPVHLSLA